MKLGAGDEGKGMEIEASIRAFVARNLLFTEDGYSYPDDSSFLREGIIDSLGVLELVDFAGTTFGIRVDPTEVTPENFDSVTRLAAFVRRKQASGPSASGERACVGS